MSDTDQINPANEKSSAVDGIPEGYRPFQSGALKLDVPKKEGYVRYWFRGEVGRVSRAIQAGWTFVTPDEVSLNNLDLGGDAKNSGNTDLGSRVSVVAGDDPTADGQTQRLYLMEIPDHLYRKGREHIDQVNDDIAVALSGGSVGKGENGEETQYDQQQRYLDRKRSRTDLFTKKNRS